MILKLKHILGVALIFLGLVSCTDTVKFGDAF